MKLISELKGYEEFTGYGIASCGKVWSFKTNNFLTLHRDKKGYLKVRISTSRTNKKTVSIHRLVALAYIPNPDGLDTVDHIDEDKNHNYVRNLRWLSRGENKSRSWSKPVKCLETGQIFNSVTIAAEEMNLHKSHVSQVCNGKRNHTGGYHFEFV